MFVLTAVEYHNAFTQTGPLLQNMKLTNIVTRDTQTAIVQPVGSTIVTQIDFKRFALILLGICSMTSMNGKRKRQTPAVVRKVVVY